jgi:hypothetical protein
VGVPADLLIYTGSFFPPMHMGTPANFSCRQALVHGICGFFKKKKGMPMHIGVLKSIT